MKKDVKAIIVAAVLTALTLTGCAENSEFNNNESITGANDGGTSSIVSSEAEESTASTVESKPEEKPVESTSSTVEKPVASTSTVESKPVSSSTSSKVEVPVSSTSKVEKPVSSTTSKPSTPVSSSSTTTPVSTSKPVEKPVHNCSTDGHIWEVTTTTTEPKWCRELHNVYDYGFDATLAKRFLNTEESTYKIFKKTLKEMGIDGACGGGGSVEVEVWGTETYETKTCTICGHIVNASDKGAINPIGEWQFVDGINRRFQVSGINMNNLFYDPYNVPQVVIDNIRIYRG